MSTVVKVDVSDVARFQEEFKKRVARSQHSLAYNTNRTAYYLAKAAQDHTPVADQNKITALGISGYKVFSRRQNKDGTFTHKRLSRPRPIYSYGGRARDIWVGGYRNRHGGSLPPELETARRGKTRLDALLFDKEHHKSYTKTHVKGLLKSLKDDLKAEYRKKKSREARKGWKPVYAKKSVGIKSIAGKMRAEYKRKIEAARDQSQAAERKIQAIITSRLRRRRFLQCGWHPAIIKFAQAISETPYKPEGLKLLKKENGDATVAKDGWNPTATIIHNALLSGPQSGRPYHQLVAAMQFAMRKVTQEMIDYQRKQLEKELAKAA